MRAVADLIDPVNESVEILKERTAERNPVIDDLLAEQAADVEREYELDYDYSWHVYNV